jgi:hypothetical protein
MPGHGDEVVPIARQGRGTQRLAVLAILLRLARARRGPDLIGGFEEPEEALEPLRQGQAARMLSELAEGGGQIFVTTHSPDVVRAFTLGDIVLISPGPRPEVRPLATSLSAPARYGLDRRVETGLTRALFVPLPVVGEGPSDKAVFETLWHALAEAGEVPRAEHLGIEALSAEGVTLMPLTVQILSEAGKDPVAWVERDEPRSQVLIFQDFAACLLLYPADASRNNLERLLAQTFSLDALAAGMSALASDRSDDWEAQRSDLTSRAPAVVGDAGRRSALAAATDLRDALAALDEVEARALVALCLAAKSGPAPFEVKGTRSARVFAEGLIARDGVVEPFRRAFIEFAVWAAQPAPRPKIQIQL